MSSGGYAFATAVHMAKDLGGPIFTQGASALRNQLGYNDVSRPRRLLYHLNHLSTVNPASPNYMPLLLNAGQAIKWFNQSDWLRASVDPLYDLELWRALEAILKQNGIAMLIPGTRWDVEGPPSPARANARMWMEMVQNSSNGPSIEDTIRNYHRSKAANAGEEFVNFRTLDWHFKRHEVRRIEDRNLLLEPFCEWSIADAAQIKWRGGLDSRTYLSLLASGGKIRAEDQTYADYLNRVLPDPHTLLRWDLARLWDGETPRRLHLDDGFNTSPVATFFAKAQGINQETLPFPDEPEGEKNWLKLAWRGSRRIPDFSTLRHLQFRLRARNVGANQSVIPDVMAWEPEQTKAALEHSGIPGPIADQMLGAITEPVPLHMLGTVLGPILEHPQVARLANTLFPAQRDWIEEALLDHGFSAKFCKLANAAIRQIATDKANAEMIAAKKQIRHDARKNASDQYKLGTFDRVHAINMMEGEQFTREMAGDALTNIDREIDLQIAGVKIAAMKDAFLTGQLNQQAVTAKMLDMQITQTRINQYLDEWNWERTTNQKHQTTGEILNTMKAGFLTPQQAIMRLTNLGWRQPDAIAEVAVVQRQMQVSQTKAMVAAQAHQAATIQHAATVAQHNAAIALRAKQKAQAAAAKLNREQILAVHKKWMADNIYYAKVHAANVRYAAAEKKGDQETMDEEINKEVAAHEEYLIAQLELMTQAPGVANVLGPLDAEMAPLPNESKGEPPPSAGAEKPAS